MACCSDSPGLLWVVLRLSFVAGGCRRTATMGEENAACDKDAFQDDEGEKVVVAVVG